MATLLTFATIQLGVSLLALAFFGFLLANVPLRLLGNNGGAGYNTRILGYECETGFEPAPLPCVWLVC